jgi:cytochrome bd-type quinol oxidase subunit 1
MELRDLVRSMCFSCEAGSYEFRARNTSAAFCVHSHVSLHLSAQLTMGLALLIVVLKIVALVRKDDSYEDAARLWTRIFAINFAMGVVTGIPMEFEFGSNYSIAGMLSSAPFGLFH